MSDQLIEAVPQILDSKLTRSYRIIRNVLADQEAELDHKIFFNQSLRDYRADKKMFAIEKRKLLTGFVQYLAKELLIEPRPTFAALFKKKFEALKRVLKDQQKIGEEHVTIYKEYCVHLDKYYSALIEAQEVEVQATQKGDQTVIPTDKILRYAKYPPPKEKPLPAAPIVTSNVHLDQHIAKTAITKKTIGKKEKAVKKKILPLESSIGNSSIHSFTTEQYFEDLEPTTGLSSPVLKRIIPKKALSVISDSEDKVEPLDPTIPISNHFTQIPNDEPNKPEGPIKVLKTPKETIKHPGSLGIIREPLSWDKDQAPSEMESKSESEDEIPEAEIIRILIKKEVKIHAKYLKATSNDNKKIILDQAQQNQLVLQKLIPNKEIESYVNGWNPWIKKKKVFPAPPKNKKRPKSDKRNQPCQSGSNRPDQTHSNYNRDQTRSTNSRNQTRSKTGRSQGRSNNIPRQTHSNHQGNNKRHRKESKDLEDEVRWAKVH
ncbi:hypothetical protein Pst134EA_011822 [Puccinia striiformis f. sp. tritici]|uniref:hypothetical protein n=1 Tax=Puccinia striiformis f. sp. tritici TaxID=168172 RepID=UPI00200797B7|nr:hypothetical protein Pst134EA_011822 [Puccinia striiformis f. sp. tritici]KAH9468193.1 hypothetical protein Pst134EA_011822 [Puccinia striiformis f. sp. tritici]